ncbi:MAG: hypothetical protein ABW020_08545 [Candidatus Rokuibacteriota bacterium]
MTGRVEATFQRGERIFDAGRTVGRPRGQYVRRPSPLPTAP